MNAFFRQQIQLATGATQLSISEHIQTLWSGYGEILRLSLRGAAMQSMVVKHVRLPKGNKHPRGWNTDLSHQRKLKSYQVETAWYTHWAAQCDSSCRIPTCYGIASQHNEVLIMLEDMDAAAYPMRKTAVSLAEMKACLHWLANFHATYLHQQPKHLWQIGTYWHLETRPDELRVLNDMPLKQAANLLDKKLNNSPFQTFVHGDAKLANFCFSEDGKQVSAVDFQYVGGGCGMKDVAYFIGSCLNEDDCERYEQELLTSYFSALKIAVEKRNLNIHFGELETNWRMLYPIAWTDFHRFLKGWSPTHWKINSYSERIAQEVIRKLTNQSPT